VIARMIKDNDPDIVEIIEGTDLTEKDHKKLTILEESKVFKEK